MKCGNCYSDMVYEEDTYGSYYMCHNCGDCEVIDFWDEFPEYEGSDEEWLAEMDGREWSDY
ncbi:MAG: hypothetical protein AMS18_00135 [Gemmatimonas sp. SG8_17]|nr:MAG: hypothetical protein AMS18_00135 [Gemmatimonas sp. SG8_17]